MLAGFLQATGMFGAVFAQAPLRTVVEGLQWRPTMYLLAMLAIVLSALLYLFIQTIPGPEVP